MKSIDRLREAYDDRLIEAEGKAIDAYWNKESDIETTVQTANDTQEGQVAEGFEDQADVE